MNNSFFLESASKLDFMNISFLSYSALAGVGKYSIGRECRKSNDGGVWSVRISETINEDIRA